MDGTAVRSFDLIGCPPSALGADHRQPDDIKSPQRESCSVAERTQLFDLASCRPFIRRGQIRSYEPVSPLASPLPACPESSSPAPPFLWPRRHGSFSGGA